MEKRKGNVFANQSQNSTQESHQKIMTTALKGRKNTAPGEDGIRYTYIRNLPAPTRTRLAKIYELSIRSAYFPKIWKKGTINLILKPQKPSTDTKSYRPITLLSALGKTLERIITKRLTVYIEEDLIPPSQAGFRKGRSTQDQILKLAQEAYRTIQTPLRNTAAVFFDIEKAYDRMWIEALAWKLQHIHGMSVALCCLLQSFLTNRQVQLKVNQEMTEYIDIKAGTPQGAILSPLIFNLWLADIPNQKKTQS